MAEYRLLIKPSAAKEIEAIGTKRDRQRIVGRIQALAEEPRRRVARNSQGRPHSSGFGRACTASLYTIDDATRTVEVIKVGHRREVYRSAR